MGEISLSRGFYFFLFVAPIFAHVLRLNRRTENGHISVYQASAYTVVRAISYSYGEWQKLGVSELQNP